ILELETARHGELADRIEQEAEEVVNHGRYRAAVCNAGCPDVALVELVVCDDAVSVTPYREEVTIRVLWSTAKAVGVVGRKLGGT
ncbi:hypothetical protein SJ358_26885, partial [Enterobacter hormaechei]